MPTIKLGRRELKALTDAAANGRAVVLFEEEGKSGSGVRFPQGRAITFFDEEVRGFGVRFHPSGHAAFILEYRPVKGGRNAPKKRLSIGPVGSMTLEAAKGEAKTLRAKIRLGADPMEERQAARRADTLEQLVRAYLSRHVTPKRKPATLALYRGYLQNHIAPRQNGPDSPLLPGLIGGKKAIAVTRKNVADLHDEIGEVHPRTANACVTLIAAAYTWGTRNGELPPDHPNPAKGIERFAENSRERSMSAEEFARLADTLALAETDGLPWEPDPAKKIKHAPKEENRRVMVDKYAVACIRLLAFTGCRLREILKLEWAHVDFQNKVLNLPDSKTGKRAVHLTAAALAILRGLQPTNHKYVIAGETAGQSDERPRADLHRPWKRIVQHAKLDSLRIHDLRHAFASVAVAGQKDIYTVSKMLGHKDIRTTMKYAHLAEDALRIAKDSVADEIQAQMNRKNAAVTPTQARDS
ncbi:MAG: tyrosine-type recombinase/integrase [Hyphomonadaceae bacterium]